MIATQQDFVELLRRRGLRATAQRLVLLEALQTLEHATIEQLLETAQPKIPNLQLSTVYRTLDTLATYGLVSHTHLAGATKTYQLATHGQHAHLVCRGCGSVQELDEQVAADLTGAIAGAHGFDVDLGHLSVFGRCASCIDGDLNHES